MISGSAALTASNNTTGSLSYINTLVNDATSSGSYFVVVPNKYMNETMANVLSNTYGYNILRKTNNGGTYLDYMISWGDNTPATPTPTPEPTATPVPTATPTPTPGAYAYNYSISALDLADATGNTDTSRNNAVFATTTQDENGSPATRKFTTAGNAYNHWLCSAAGITPTFGYYKNNVLITSPLNSTQTMTGAC